MKKVFLIIFLFPLFAISNSKLDKLIEVNANWSLNPDGIEVMDGVDFALNDNFIINHLMLVEQTLRKRPVNQLTAKQRAKRIYYLDVLKSYWKEGKFPKNTYQLKRTPIFIDRNGTHCAVGYLMQQGGYISLAQSIDKLQNFAYIKEIKHPELLLWQNESGLSLDELAWIQPSYAFEGEALAIGNGLSGNVKDIKIGTGKYIYIAAGSFTIEPDTQSVLLAGWDGSCWNSIISGTGIINKIKISQNAITSYGGNMSFDNFNQVEIIETILGTEIPKHKLMGEFYGEVTDYEIYNNTEFVCGKFSGGLAIKKGNDWLVTPVDECDSVNAIKVYLNKLYLSGSRKDHLYYPFLSFDGSRFEQIKNFSNKPTCFGVFMNQLLIGMKQHRRFSDSLVYSYDGSKIETYTKFINLYGFEVKSITNLQKKLILTGNLGIDDFFYRGFGLAFYNSEKPDEIWKIIYLNGIVNTAILTSKDSIIVAGNFTYFRDKNNTRPSLLGCGIVFEGGKIPQYLPINPLPQLKEYAFPNPTRGLIRFSEPGTLYDANGRKIISISQGENNLENLSKGIYIFSNQNYSLKILKE